MQVVEDKYSSSAYLLDRTGQLIIRDRVFKPMTGLGGGENTVQERQALGPSGYTTHFDFSSETVDHHLRIQGWGSLVYRAWATLQMLAGSSTALRLSPSVIVDRARPSEGERSN